MALVISDNLKVFIHTAFLILLCFFFTSHIRSPSPPFNLASSTAKPPNLAIRDSCIALQHFNNSHSKCLYLKERLRSMGENLAALAGRNNNPRRERGRRGNEEILVAQCKLSNSMLARALKIALAIASHFLTTDTGKELLESALAAKDDDFATTPIHIFILSMVAYVWLALVSRIFKFRSPTLEDCSAFLMAMMVVSLAAVFVHDQIPWLIYTPMLFPVLLVVRKVRGLDDQF